MIVEKTSIGTQGVGFPEENHNPIKIKDNINLDYIIDEGVADDAMLLDANNGVFLLEPSNNNNNNNSTNNNRFNNDNNIIDQKICELKRFKKKL